MSSVWLRNTTYRNVSGSSLRETGPSVLLHRRRIISFLLYLLLALALLDFSACGAQSPESEPLAFLTAPETKKTKARKEASDTTVKKKGVKNLPKHNTIRGISHSAAVRSEQDIVSLIDALKEKHGITTTAQLRKSKSTLLDNRTLARAVALELQRREMPLRDPSRRGNWRPRTTTVGSLTTSPLWHTQNKLALDEHAAAPYTFNEQLFDNGEAVQQQLATALGDDDPLIVKDNGAPSTILDKLREYFQFKNTISEMLDNGMIKYNNLVFRGGETKKDGGMGTTDGFQEAI